MTNPRIKDWNHYFYLNPSLRKSTVAMELGVTPSFFSKLMDPVRYHPLVTSEIVYAIAEKWNQSPEYVQRLYPRMAA